MSGRHEEAETQGVRHITVEERGSCTPPPSLIKIHPGNWLQAEFHFLHSYGFAQFRICRPYDDEDSPADPLRPFNAAPPIKLNVEELDVLIDGLTRMRNAYKE